MIHILLELLGAMLIAITLPLVLELTLVTAANLLPDRGPIQERSAVLISDPAQAVAPRLRLAVIVPAHNEELLVARSVLSLLAAATDSTSILVVAHNCTDKTAEHARAAGAEVLVYDDPAAKGKGFALRHGFDRYPQHRPRGHSSDCCRSASRSVPL
jgi:cellulose synthase/poly-beta-1,6-N-acetylglucosamine synthase-like glycosyltransferase